MTEQIALASQAGRQIESLLKRHLVKSQLLSQSKDRVK